MNKYNTYSYFKVRKDFGKQPLFCEVPAYIIDSILPNRIEQKQYCLRNPGHNNTQTSICYTEHEVNTERITHQERGINHKEGGWSNEINIDDEEAIMRYRRRIERDDSYINAMIGSYPNFEHYIKQNNAIDMYTMYFKKMPSVSPPTKHSVVVSGKFKDPYFRPVGSIDWTNEEQAKVVVAYCDKTYQAHDINKFEYHCSVWDLEKSYVPLFNLSAPSACWEVIASQREPSLFFGGLEDGRVCIFDIRVKNIPIVLSPKHSAHLEPVSALVHFRNSTEFFSGSTDGRCLWWDSRNLKEPYDELIICSKHPVDSSITLKHSEPISVLQYERSLPTKFMCGTATGLVINVNRKGKTHKEKMSSVFKTHNGPIKALHRSPITSKIFMTCGDWTVKIWNEDLHISPILLSSNKLHSVSDAAWAPKKFTSYMTISSDGKFRYWDLLSRQHIPVLSFPVSIKSLLKLKIHEEGKLVAIGDSDGTLNIITLSDHLISSKHNDKLLMTDTLDRESRREHILEMRIKEIRLKVGTGKTKDAVTPINDYNEAFLLKKVEEDFRKIVQQERRAETI